MKLIRIALTVLTAWVAITAYAEPSFNQGMALLRQEGRKMSLSHRPMTIDQGLLALKKNADFAPLFRHYTLVKNSLSLQSSTPLEPRVVMFGLTANLVVTFNSKSAEAGQNSLETAEFDSTQNRILFREILFKDEFSNELKARIGPSRSLKKMNADDLSNEFLLSADEIEYEDTQLAITKPNPQKCMQCHALSAENYPGVARYIWQDYKTWKGVYGEADDNLDASKNEGSQLAAFKVVALSADRFKNLDGLKIPNFPYSVGPLKAGGYGTRPNLLLTDLLFTRFGKVVAQAFFNRMTPEARAQFKITVEQESNSPSAIVARLKPVAKTLILI